MFRFRLNRLQGASGISRTIGTGVLSTLFIVWNNTKQVKYFLQVVYYKYVIERKLLLDHCSFNDGFFPINTVKPLITDTLINEHLQ
jgi:hypothetical protein